uniref:Uncharacterized protein n=1 Tax=Sphaerodactylus townsendi TaxID=933632 RepID=A0ACB8FJD0_9SAUR
MVFEETEEEYTSKQPYKKKDHTLPKLLFSVYSKSHEASIAALAATAAWDKQKKSRKLQLKWKKITCGSVRTTQPSRDDIEDKCQKMACKCDREAAKCLAKAPYNATHIWWPVARCGTSSPSCEED